MAKPARKHWFWAWTVLSTVHKSRADDPTAPCEVWKNCIIIRARDESEALRKAQKIGQSEVGDSCGSLRLDGEPAICKFLGISSLGLVHEPLRDSRDLLDAQTMQAIDSTQDADSRGNAAITGA